MTKLIGYLYNIPSEILHHSFGEYYSILDESGDWYRYSVKFFEENFK